MSVIFLPYLRRSMVLILMSSEGIMEINMSFKMKMPIPKTDFFLSGFGIGKFHYLYIT